MIVFKGGRLSGGGKASGSGGGFGGLVHYLMEGRLESDGSLAADVERVAWTATRNLDTDSAYSAAKIMRAQASENPRVERPVYHFGLSLAQGEHLSQEQWEAGADRVLAGLGLENHQVLMVAHGDTDVEHVHLVVNRVGDDGRAWNARQDMVRAYEVVHALERELKLHVTGVERGDRVPELAATAYREARRLEEPPLVDQVRVAAGGDFAVARDWRDLEERLASHGLRLEPARHGSGLLVTDGKRLASLSSVDRELSGPRLEARFGESFREYRVREPEGPAIAVPDGGRGLAGETLEERAAALVERVSATRATYTESDLRRASFYEADARGLLAEALSPAHSVPVGAGGQGVARYSSQSYLEAETKLFRSAEELGLRRGFVLDGGAVQKSMAHLETSLGLSWTEEQKRAIFHATRGADLAQVVGRAGAGKTTAARAIAEAYTRAGFEVSGAALAGKAAEGLSREAAIPARTLASLEYAWQEGRDRLHGGSVLLIDEAGMVDTRTLGRVLGEAEEARAKVILLGDPDQLKAIGAGDAFRGLLVRHESTTLEEVRRQVESWQRQASQDLAAGRVGAALDAYGAAGRVTWADSQGEARERLVAQYVEDREAGGSQIALAYRNADARALNEGIREQLKARGALPAEGAEVNGREFAAGDRLVFLENDHRGARVLGVRAEAAVGVKNGTLGTVELAGEERFLVRLDDGRRVVFDPRQYDQVSHGYAVTIHKSQGATVDRAYVLTDPLMDRNASYVALTRHRHGVEIYADRERFGEPKRLTAALSRVSQKDLAIDYRLASGQVREWYGSTRFAALDARIADVEKAHEVASTAWHALHSKVRSHTLAEGAVQEATQRFRGQEAATEEARQAALAVAAKVFRDPVAALERIQDRAATKSLTEGVTRETGRALGAEAFGELAGTAKIGFIVRTVYQDRLVALASLPELAKTVSAYLDSREALARQQSLYEAAESRLRNTPEVDSQALKPLDSRRHALSAELAALKSERSHQVERSAKPIAVELEKLHERLMEVRADKAGHERFVQQLDKADLRSAVEALESKRSSAATLAYTLAARVFRDPVKALEAVKKHAGWSETVFSQIDSKMSRAPGAERYGELEGHAFGQRQYPPQRDERSTALTELPKLGRALAELRTAEQALQIGRRYEKEARQERPRGSIELDLSVLKLARAGLAAVRQTEGGLEDFARQAVAKMGMHVVGRAVELLPTPVQAVVGVVTKVLQVVQSISRGHDHGMGL